MIPASEMWNQYVEGNVTEDSLTVWSIDMFVHHRDKLEEKEPDDLSDEKIDSIYSHFATAGRSRKLGLIL
jgi:hypothetical protein